MKAHTTRLLAAAANTELWAIWPDPKLPDGYASALLVSPDTDLGQTRLAAVPVEDFAQAMALADALEPDARRVSLGELLAGLERAAAHASM